MTDQVHSISPETVHGLLKDMPQLFYNAVNSNTIRSYEWNGENKVDSLDVLNWMQFVNIQLGNIVRLYGVKGEVTMRTNQDTLYAYENNITGIALAI